VIIRTFDILIISGGGQLLDSWGGPWKYPYTILKWVLLAKLGFILAGIAAGSAGQPIGNVTAWLNLNANEADIFSNRFAISNLAYKPGGGMWADSSDLRVKTITGNYRHGLAELEQLRPVTYTFRGNETNTAAEPPRGEPPYQDSPHWRQALAATEFVGLIAQDCETVMPELVSQRAARIDGVLVNDLRDLDTGPLLFALINAVKELSARVRELESR